ncbi:unnamed protein product [Cuscuta campestris]|uniref:Uncharacterized protein n=1 Tax=Cuscuta campestris TaxID=132261 RepID=A0A484NA73_9ASTE|nr:unnamed protein product [Cuscuta campestris]
MDENNEPQNDTPRAAKGGHRKSSSSLSISALFHGHLHRRHDLIEPSSPLSPDRSPRVNPSRWIGSKHHHHNSNNQSPEIRGRCGNIAAGIGRHRRRHTSDLTYDPLSYAHNFESDDDSPLKNSFTARLRAGEGATQRAETGADDPNPPPGNKDGKKTRRKSFDLNDLMTVAKGLEELEAIQNAGDSNPLEMRSMATILEEALQTAGRL